MVNYKAIADEAEKYANYEQAFLSMSAQTEDEFTELSSNNLREWCVKNKEDYESIKSDSTVVSEMAIKQIQIDSSPLDMRKKSVRDFIQLLPISNEGKLTLLEIATKKVKKWPNLKAGHVQNALQKRSEGKV